MFTCVISFFIKHQLHGPHLIPLPICCMEVPPSAAALGSNLSQPCQDRHLQTQYQRGRRTRIHRQGDWIRSVLPRARPSFVRTQWQYLLWNSPLLPTCVRSMRPASWVSCWACTVDRHRGYFPTLECPLPAFFLSPKVEAIYIGSRSPSNSTLSMISSTLLGSESLFQLPEGWEAVWCSPGIQLRETHSFCELEKAS